jgi:hypothetical protein
MFDMASDLHALQPHVAEAVAATTSLARQVRTLGDTVAKRDDVPADVKASLGSLAADLKTLEPRLSAPPRGFGGNPRANEILMVKLGQAKNVLADLNAVIAKAQPVSASLAKYNVTLEVPQPVKAIPAAAPRKTSTHE